MIQNHKLEKVIEIAIEVKNLAQQVLNDQLWCEATNKKIEETVDPASSKYYSERKYPSTKLSAALKRRSMDLTRALAEMRRG